MFTASRSYKHSRTVLTSLGSCIRRRISLSAVEGARDPSLDNRTLPEYFSAEVLSRRPDHPALICRQERPRAHGGPLSKNMGVESHLAWNFNEFDSHIKALARGLVGLGVNKGDRVGVVMGNTRYVFLTHGCYGYSICLPFSKCVCDAAMGMCKHRSNIGHHKSCLSYPRAGGLSWYHHRAWRVDLSPQIEAIRVVGISHLFLVPQIRTSSYLTLLAEALPSLRKFCPGDIQEEVLPDLKHVVVIDNTHQPKRFHEILGDIHCAVDFREVLLWQDGGTKENRIVDERIKTLDKDDVTNIQFTRSFLFSQNAQY